MSGFSSLTDASPFTANALPSLLIRNREKCSRAKYSVVVVLLLLWSGHYVGFEESGKERVWVSLSKHRTVLRLCLFLLWGKPSPTNQPHTQSPQHWKGEVEFQQKAAISKEYRIYHIYKYLCVYISLLYVLYYERSFSFCRSCQCKWCAVIEKC